MASSNTAPAKAFPPGTAAAVRRSLQIYRRDRAREPLLDAWYAQFVSPGALVFDIGAHAGDRTACFARLGARVVAAEPQPAFARLLRFLHRADAHVTIEPVAVGAREGSIALNLNVDNPTVSTVSPDFIAAARGVRGWETQTWARTIDVPVSTLDALVARHGQPSFVKLDVEGWEYEALRGLSRMPAVLSFEFTTIQKDVALACLQRLASLGATRFRASLGESLAFVEHQQGSLDLNGMASWLEALPLAANSGDVYAYAEG
ncbi:MAG: methyltransferase FkbM [Hyphomicrobiales bacterium]|nr:methyltransferase FkbM [Hyphomicrobiales bacterium]